MRLRIAKNGGLCPHVKNHPLGGWMFIVLCEMQVSIIVDKRGVYHLACAFYGAYENVTHPNLDDFIKAI